MNKFTDSFFQFPIKVYDSKELKRKENREEEGDEVYGEVDWIAGVVGIHVSDINSGNFYYQDWFSDRSVEEVKDEGFDQTAVYIDKYGEFICTWPRKKFEAKLNEFMAKQGTKKEEDLEL